MSRPRPDPQAGEVPHRSAGPGGHTRWWLGRTAGRCAALGALLLTACAGQLPAVPGLGSSLGTGGSSTQDGAPQSDGRTAPGAAAASPSRGTGPAGGGPANRPALAAEVLPPFKPDTTQALFDIADPDPKVCRAVADGGTAQNLALITQLGATLGMEAVTQRLNRGQTDFSGLIDSIRPGLRELSRRVVWMPESVEVLVGQQLLRLSPDNPYVPSNAAERRIVDQVLRPSFEVLARFAREELKSEQKFELRFTQRAGLSPEMVPGGVLIVPQGLLKALAQIPERDAARRQQIVGFVLAHEFSHALKRHITKATQVRLIDSMTMAKVFQQNFKGVSSGFRNATDITQLFDFSAKGIKLAVDTACHAEKWFTDLNQNQEFEADVCGALLLSKLPAGPNQRLNAAEGMRQYVRLSASIPPAPVARGFCVQPASHPDIPERERNLQQFSSKLSAS